MINTTHFVNGLLLAGHTRQGLKCRHCKLNVHVDCQEEVQGRCQQKSRLLRRQKSTSELDTSRTSASAIAGAGDVQPGVDGEDSEYQNACDTNPGIHELSRLCFLESVVFIVSISMLRIFSVNTCTNDTSMFTALMSLCGCKNKKSNLFLMFLKKLNNIYSKHHNIITAFYYFILYFFYSLKKNYIYILL